MSTSAPVPPATEDSLNWSQLRAAALQSIDRQEIPDDIELPALPQAVTEFVDHSADPNFEYSRLAEIVEKDAGLTCELLRYVNSASGGLTTPIRSATKSC